VRWHLGCRVYQGGQHSITWFSPQGNPFGSWVAYGRAQPRTARRRTPLALRRRVGDFVCPSGLGARHVTVRIGLPAFPERTYDDAIRLPRLSGNLMIRRIGLLLDSVLFELLLYVAIFLLNLRLYSKQIGMVSDIKNTPSARPRVRGQWSSHTTSAFPHHGARRPLADRPAPRFRHSLPAISIVGADNSVDQEADSNSTDRDSDANSYMC